MDTPIQEDMEALVESQIGRLYWLRPLATGSQDESEMEQSPKHYVEVFNRKASPLALRIKASKVVSTIFDSLSRPDEGAAILKQAINLLPALKLRYLYASDQQEVLKQANGLSSKAAAMALMSAAGGHQALAILERGRGIIFGLLTETRMDMSMFDPQTASELLEARRAICALRSVTLKPSPFDSLR
ncbi:hypothetical protein ACLX1H_011256 [Fusarium chlamydosporum]